MIGSTFGVARSGLEAAQARLDAVASNVANLPTEGYRRVVIQAEPLATGGVAVRPQRWPTAGPDLLADEVQRRQAALAWAANLQVFKAADQQVGSLLHVRA